MRRTLIAIVVGLLVAFGISFGLNFILAAAGAKPMASNSVMGLVVGTSIAGAIMAAGARKPARKADASQKAAALGEPPPSGFGRLTVYREGVAGSRLGADLIVDGQEVVQIVGKQFASLTLPPGRHTVRLKLAGAANAGSKPAELDLTLGEGETAVVRMTLAMKLTTSDVVLAKVDQASAASKLSSRTMVVAPA